MTTGTQLQTSATPGASPTTHAPASTTSASTSTEKRQNKTWIAGAVIGSVAGCVIFGCLGFWLARRSRDESGRDGKTEAHENTYPETPRGREGHSITNYPQELPGNSKNVPSEIYTPQHE